MYSGQRPGSLKGLPVLRLALTHTQTAPRYRETARPREKEGATFWPSPQACDVINDAHGDQLESDKLDRFELTLPHRFGLLCGRTLFVHPECKNTFTVLAHVFKPLYLQLV